MYIAKIMNMYRFATDKTKKENRNNPILSYGWLMGFEPTTFRTTI